MSKRRSEVIWYGVLYSLRYTHNGSHFVSFAVRAKNKTTAKKYISTYVEDGGSLDETKEYNISCVPLDNNWAEGEVVDL